MQCIRYQKRRLCIGTSVVCPTHHAFEDCLCDFFDVERHAIGLGQDLIYCSPRQNVALLRDWIIDETCTRSSRLTVNEVTWGCSAQDKVDSGGAAKQPAFANFLRCRGVARAIRGKSDLPNGYLRRRESQVVARIGLQQSEESVERLFF